MASHNLYKMGTMARLAAISPSLLRAWERRYDLLEPLRTPGGHRLYTDDDLAVVLRVRHWMEQGRSIGEAARLGRRALLAESGATHRPDEPAGRADELDLCADRVVRGAIELDADAVRGGLDHAFAIASPADVARRVIGPAAEEIGLAWREGRCGIAGEHMATALFRQRLGRLFEAAAGTVRGRGVPVLCAGLPDEQHELGALVVAYYLAVAGHDVHYLGANLPLEELERASSRLTPRAVFLSVTRPGLLDLHRPRLLDLARRWKGSIQITLGGQGTRGDTSDLEASGVAIWRGPAHGPPMLQAGPPERA